MGGQTWIYAVERESQDLRDSPSPKFRRDFSGIFVGKSD
jgi:hypothetical protein